MEPARVRVMRATLLSQTSPVYNPLSSPIAITTSTELDGIYRILTLHSFEKDLVWANSSGGKILIAAIHTYDVDVHKSEKSAIEHIIGLHKGDFILVPEYFYKYRGW